MAANKILVADDDPVILGLLEVNFEMEGFDLAADIPHLETIDEPAGPGFLNFRLAPTWLHAVLRDVVAQGEAYGRGDALAGERINLEFVSANPTGPLHAGGGRWAAVGDALANLLATQGAEVHREYLLNDAGTQLDAFAGSLLARLHGTELPDDGYAGQYVVDMAERMRADLGADPSLEQAREWGYAAVLEDVRGDLDRIGVHFDTWFSERTLHQRGDVEATIGLLREQGAVEERDGAVWFKATDYGDDRDRVLIKSDGSPTYLAADLAYHRDKLARGFTHLIDIWGADHHGQVKSLQAGMRALGVAEHGAFGPEPEVILGQLVTLMRDGEPVRISKRTGNVVTLGEVLDEVDPDACRLTFLLQGLDTTQKFDPQVVTEQASVNPVFYVQYAHARIASILRKAADRGVEPPPIDDVDLTALPRLSAEADPDLDLLRSLAELPDVLAEAARTRAPQKVSTWVRDLARDFHAFYQLVRVLPGDDEVADERHHAALWLVRGCQIGLANALAVLGVHAPEQMDRLDDPIDDGAVT